MKKLTKDFFIALVIRAIWTMAETALGMLTVGAALSEVQWAHIASVTVVAGIYSMIKSLAVGLPEIMPDVNKGDVA